jgi:mRNA-degrading endonuclease RelE of RelBE toxin-antitoxin system
MNQLFVEAKPFSRKWPNYLTEDELRKFQNYLLVTPDAGEIVKGAGGIRKVRWNVAGGGKRGGLRIIYYWKTSLDQIYLLTIYRKNELADLTPADYKFLKQAVERW